MWLNIGLPTLEEGNFVVYGNEYQELSIGLQVGCLGFRISEDPSTCRLLNYEWKKTIVQQSAR